MAKHATCPECGEELESVKKMAEHMSQHEMSQHEMK
jgi:ribosomal protein L34E